MIVRWSSAAARQLFALAETLDRRRRGAGDRLYTAIDDVVAIIREQPRAFARASSEDPVNIRRALVVRYQHWIIYRIEGNEIEVLVLAFWSTRQNPEGWRRRR